MEDLISSGQFHILSHGETLRPQDKDMKGRPLETSIHKAFKINGTHRDSKRRTFRNLSVKWSSLGSSDEAL